MPKNIENIQFLSPFQERKIVKLLNLIKEEKPIDLGQSSIIQVSAVGDVSKNEQKKIKSCKLTRNLTFSLDLIGINEIGTVKAF